MPIHFNTGTLSTILNQVEMFVQKLSMYSSKSYKKLRMRGSSNIRSVLIDVEYQNPCQTLDVHLLTFCSFS